MTEQPEAAAEATPKPLEESKTLLASSGEAAEQPQDKAQPKFLKGVFMNGKSKGSYFMVDTE